VAQQFGIARLIWNQRLTTDFFQCFEFPICPLPQLTNIFEFLKISGPWTA
jgi:hypothetical protein